MILGVVSRLSQRREIAGTRFRKEARAILFL